MAREYKMLPSEIRARATTYDIMIYDITSTWDAHKASGGKAAAPSTEEMMERLKNARAGV